MATSREELQHKRLQSSCLHCDFSQKINSALAKKYTSQHKPWQSHCINYLPQKSTEPTLSSHTSSQNIEGAQSTLSTLWWTGTFLKNSPKTTAEAKPWWGGVDTEGKLQWNLPSQPVLTEALRAAGGHWSTWKKRKRKKQHWDSKWVNWNTLRTQRQWSQLFLHLAFSHP